MAATCKLSTAACLCELKTRPLFASPPSPTPHEQTALCCSESQQRQPGVASRGSAGTPSNCLQHAARTLANSCVHALGSSCKDADE